MPIISSLPFKPAPLNPSDEIILSDSESSDPKLKTKNTSLKALASFNSVSYDFTQGIPAAVWNIEHNLDKYPSVTAVDNSKEVVIGRVQYVDKDNIKITFSAAFSGYAYLN